MSAQVIMIAVLAAVAFSAVASLLAGAAVFLLAWEKTQPDFTHAGPTFSRTDLPRRQS